MDADLLTKEKVEFFFNKYKYNNDLLCQLERRLLKESYEFKKWETMFDSNTALARKLYLENEELIKEYIVDILEHGDRLKSDALQAILTHITFFLCENNLDSLVTIDILESLMKHEDSLGENERFHVYMNMAMALTLSHGRNFEDVYNYYEKAMLIYPSFSSVNDKDTKIHLVFCRNFELFAFAFYKSKNYKGFVEVYNKTKDLLYSGNEELFKKMWGEGVDFNFHLEYLLRFFRMYGILMIGQNDFSLTDSKDEDNFHALNTIKGWLETEFKTEAGEGEVNTMIFTYFHKMRLINNDTTLECFFDVLYAKFSDKSFRKDNRNYIFPETIIPDDGDPVNPIFSKTLNKMKIFNKTFSFIYIFLLELYKASDNHALHRQIYKEILLYYGSCKYAIKGFNSDCYIKELINTVSSAFDYESDFLILMQVIFIHKDMATTLHFGIVSTIVGLCFYHLVEQRPELFIIPGIAESVETVLEKKEDLLKFIKVGALVHDVGKIRDTEMINYSFRNKSKKEIEYFQKHSEIGTELLSIIPLIQKYEPFVNGHHKYWNNTDGYPESFDLTNSPYRYYINLLTFADCLDNETRPRNLKLDKIKTFNEFFREVKTLAGSKYSPDIVNLIEKNEGLKEELRVITSTGRNYTSYQTYLRFIKPNTEFTKDDEKVITQATPALLKKLPQLYARYNEDVDPSLIKKYVASFIDGKNTRVYIMHNQKEEIFGIIAGRIQWPLDGNKTFLIEEFYIIPEERRKGYGTDLLSKTIELLKLEEITRLRINKEDDFNSVSFFFLNGFLTTKKNLMEKSL